MKRNLIRFATVAAMAAGMAFAQAPANPGQQPPARNQVARRAMIRQRMMRQLNLSDAQKEQAKVIFHQARQTAEPWRAQLKENRQALALAIKTDDTAGIHSLTAKAAGLRAQTMEIRADAMAKFYSTLTPAQRAKADQLHQQFRQRMEQRRAGRTNG